MGKLQLNIRKTMSLLIAGLMIIAMLMTSALTVHAEENTGLGVAEDYHIFAREAYLNAHTCGNIAVERLVQCNSNFGSSYALNGRTEETSYIKNLDTIMSSSYADPLIIGSSVETVSMDNGNAIGVKTQYGDTKLDHIKNVIVDDNFIDFDAEFSHLESVLSDLVSKENVGNVSYDDSDFNNAVLRADDTQVIYNITASQLQSVNQITLDNVDMVNGTVIINVDMSSVAGDMFNVPTKIVLKDNFGMTHTNMERSYFENSRVLWNFYNYDGKIIFQREWMGSILAPTADVQVQSNIDGSIICNSFCNYGETHKWDFNGTINFSEAGDNNEPDTPDVPDQPENPEPDDPEQDNPGEDESTLKTLSGNLVWLNFDEETDTDTLNSDYTVSLYKSGSMLMSCKTNRALNWYYEFKNAFDSNDDISLYSLKVSGNNVESDWELSVDYSENGEVFVMDILIEQPENTPDEPSIPDNPATDVPSVPDTDEPGDNDQGEDVEVPDIPETPDNPETDVPDTEEPVTPGDEEQESDEREEGQKPDDGDINVPETPDITVDPEDPDIEQPSDPETDTPAEDNNAEDIEQVPATDDEINNPDIDQVFDENDVTNKNEQGTNENISSDSLDNHPVENNSNEADNTSVATGDKVSLIGPMVFVSTAVVGLIITRKKEN